MMPASGENVKEFDKNSENDFRNPTATSNPLTLGFFGIGYVYEP
jgi:hypothetical protein